LARGLRAGGFHACDALSFSSVGCKWVARLSSHWYKQMASHVLNGATRFRVDYTPRRADCQYVAHARISLITSDGYATEIESGDLMPFVERSEAVAYAEMWARRWMGHDPSS